MNASKAIRPREGVAGAGPLSGNTKVTREDWLTVAMDILVSQGVEKVKVLPIGERLGVSRSSFYWYFRSRQDLLDALLDAWEHTNTQAIVEHASCPADTITRAVCHLFRCFLSSERFDHRLDFAVREWARRSGEVRRVVDCSDATRLIAIQAMFERFDYAPYNAETRARVLYYMQIGYSALELHEPLDTRLSFLAGYLEAFTGRKAARIEIDEFLHHAKGLRAGAML